MPIYDAVKSTHNGYTMYGSLSMYCRWLTTKDRFDVYMSQLLIMYLLGL